MKLRPGSQVVDFSLIAGKGGVEVPMTAEALFMTGALIVAGVGGATDVATRRIPNWLTYSGMLVAIAGRSVLQGWHGLGSALAGGLIGGGIFLVFFLLHAMGAGDVKLITAIGCLVGPSSALQIVLATAIAGGIFAVVLSLWQGRLRAVLVNVVDLIKFHAVAGAEVHPTLNLSNPQATRLPYGVAIATGVLYSVVAFYRRGGI
ncbi:MAG: A24 family peptidase [Terracidiphilus sp.]